jgi:hypothetical protein
MRRIIPIWEKVAVVLVFAFILGCTLYLKPARVALSCPSGTQRLETSSGKQFCMTPIWVSE